MCGHIFNYVAGPILCPHCREKMEAKFQEVKEYIRANPGVGIQDVAENCDVEPSQIQQWLREERLELTEGSAIYLQWGGRHMGAVWILPVKGEAIWSKGKQSNETVQTE